MNMQAIQNLSKTILPSIVYFCFTIDNDTKRANIRLQSGRFEKLTFFESQYTYQQLIFMGNKFGEESDKSDEFLPLALSTKFFFEMWLC